MSIFCSKCGAQNTEDNAFCSQCGAPLAPVAAPKKDNTNAKGSLFTGHLLNIIAAVLPGLLWLAAEMMSSSGTSDPNADVTVTVDPGALPAEIHVVIALAIGFVVFVIGLLIYFLKDAKVKQILSYVYIAGAIIGLGYLFGTWGTYIVLSCGLGAVMFIPGILQIVAGIKFATGAKQYAN